MEWQLVLAFSTTIPALLIAGFLVLCIFYRRLRVFQYNRALYLRGPVHINHSRCRCQCCSWERQQLLG